jgi:DNA processing protein
MDRPELGLWLRLTATPGVGTETARMLLARFGLPETIFEQSAATLREVVGPAVAGALAQPPAELDQLVQETWDWLHGTEHGGARAVVTLADRRYPKGLLVIEDPPPVLYLHGAVHWLGQGVSGDANPLVSVAHSGDPVPVAAETAPLGLDRCMAIVGSRNPTPQGADNARQFADALAQAGLTVVSGLALGIDGAAHAGALDARPGEQERPATVAVVGTGLDRVYPKRHLALARRIAREGLIISEYPIGTHPIAANFPRRNRIISGLSHGTLVVEAALQSGSLITARLAAEQGKEVFAVPGSIHSTQSRGCHALIRQGAKLVESAQDILEELPPHLFARPARSPQTGVAVCGSVPAETPPGTDPALLQSLGHDPVRLDTLQARTGLDTARLQAQLMALELAGLVGRMPGGLFQRIARV